MISSAVFYLERIYLNAQNGHFTRLIGRGTRFFMGYTLPYELDTRPQRSRLKVCSSIRVSSKLLLKNF